MAPLQVLDENALAVVKLKPVQNTKGSKQSKLPGEIDSQIYELKGDLRHVEKQQTAMKTQQANLHDKYVSLQHDVDELKSVIKIGVPTQTPLKTRVDAGCGPSPPVPAVQVRSGLAVEATFSAGLYKPCTSLPPSVDGEELKAEQQRLREQVLQLQSFLTPELQQALTALVSSSKSDDKATISKLDRCLEVQTTRNARLEEELAESNAQLKAQKGLNEELETKLSEAKKALAAVESSVDELDTAEVSGMLSSDDIATPLPRIPLSSMRNKRVSSLRSGAPQLPPVVPPSPFKM